MEMLVIEGPLMLEEKVVHLPESVLVGRRLGRFRRMLRMGMDLT
jgi:hypothetical protein